MGIIYDFVKRDDKMLALIRALARMLMYLPDIPGYWLPRGRDWQFGETAVPIKGDRAVSSRRNKSVDAKQVD